jgi:hypothetical protein
MEHAVKNTCVFVIVQDYGHFAYTTHLARALHNKGYAIEYWSHKSAQSQCPHYASFHWLTDAQSFTDFYCLQSSYGELMYLLFTQRDYYLLLLFQATTIE